jgi:hypothetical protein
MQLPTKKVLKPDNSVSQQKVKVVCRVRPFLPHEFADDSIGVDGNSIKITNQRNPTEILKYRSEERKIGLLNFLVIPA